MLGADTVNASPANKHDVVVTAAPLKLVDNVNVVDPLVAVM